MTQIQTVNSQEASDLPRTQPGLAQELADLALQIMQLTLESGQDQDAGSLRRLLIQLTDFQQAQRRLAAGFEQAPAEAGAPGLWHQLREVEILLRNLEHHIMLVQARFQQRGTGKRSRAA